MPTISREALPRLGSSHEGVNEAALSFIRDNRRRFVAELGKFIGFPSISAQDWHAGDVDNCAVWLADHLREVGLQEVKIVPTRRHPIVYASWRQTPERPTVLIYGHYDVQPPEPLAEWLSPPFEPIVRFDYIYGRGASDDKGQMFVHVKAIESYLKTAGRLPVNLICLFEGEEEIGSPSLRSFLIAESHTLTADCAVVIGHANSRLRASCDHLRPPRRAQS